MILTCLVVIVLLLPAPQSEIFGNEMPRVVIEQQDDIKE
jgi:hypothetical protein